MNINVQAARIGEQVCPTKTPTMSEASKQAYQIANYLEKMNSSDKDFRFMAISDLMGEFQKNNIKLDEDSERKVIRMLLRLLEDKNAEVQNLAVRCLSTIAGTIRDYSCEIIVDALCDNMAKQKDDLREVSSTALSGFIKSLPPGVNATKIAIRVLPKLHSVLFGLSGETSAKNEILDMIGEVLCKNGTTLIAHHAETERVLLEHVCSGRASVRKRAIVALSHLSVAASVDLYNDIVNKIIQHLNEPRADLRILVAALIALGKACSQRFAHFLPQVVPIFLKYADSSDDELREGAIQGLETVVVRCPKEAASAMPQIEEKVKLGLVHDPNYSYEDDDAEEMEIGDDDEYDDDEDDYDDDDDMSWKVRRAAAKTIEAMIDTRREDQCYVASTFGPLLISRLKEREENVRSDVFHAYSALLKRTAANRDPAVVEVLRSQLPTLLKSLLKVLRSKNGKARQQVYVLLSKLVRAVDNCLNEVMIPIMDTVVSVLSDGSTCSVTKIDVLVFLEHVLPAHTPETFFPCTAALVPAVSKSVKDLFYKVSSQALVVSASLLEVLRMKSDGLNEVETLYTAIIDKLKADVDQEVKEKAILAVGTLLKYFTLGDKAEAMLKILIDRVNNEATQLTALKALTMVVESPNGQALIDILPSLIPILTQLVKKTSRAVKMHSITLILSICKHYPSALTTEFLSIFTPILPSLISDIDLQISQLTLKTLSVCVVECPSQLTPWLPSITHSIVNLCKSSILQGATLAALLEFMTTFVKSPIPGKKSFEELLDEISHPVYTDSSLSRQSLHLIAALVAVVAAADQDQSNAPKLASRLAEQMKDNRSSDANRLFALLTLGELGKRCPHVYNETNLMPEKLILDVFGSPNEDIKSAGSVAMGGLVVGNLPHYLPFLLQQINTEPKRLYLLLHALKEVIAYETSLPSSDPSFIEQVDDVWNVLMKHADTSEEGTRCVVAECLGKLCHANPSILLPRLKEFVTTDSVNMRAAVVTSVKFMITDEKKPIDDVLDGMMADFLSTANDSNLDVRRVALVVLNSAAHNKPSLIRNHLSDLLPIVYEETKVRTELIREVEMGPFKHSVDDGLDLRKSAFECMYTLLDSCVDRLDIFTFITALEKGLNDHHDIKLLSYLILSKLAQLCPNELTQKLDKICEPLKTQLQSKNKQNAVKQELDKAEELKRAVLRTMLALLRMPEASRIAQLSDLRAVVNNTADLRSVFEGLERDMKRSGGYSHSDSIDMM